MIGKLHRQIETAQRNLLLAGQAGLPYEAYLHRAHLEELLDAATHRGINVESWVDRSLLPPLVLFEV